MQETNRIINRAFNQVSDSDREYAGRCVKLWRQFIDKQITRRELQKELAYLAVGDMQAWRVLNYRPLPTRPKRLREYDALSSAQKEKSTERFWREPEIFNYLESCARVKAENKKIIAWLQELKDIFEREGDEHMRIKTEQRIFEFSDEEKEGRFDD